MFPADWMQFRGPNGSGVGDATQLPAHFGPEKNALWKTAVPWGHSSPVIVGDLIFITGAEGGSRTDAGREKGVDQGSSCTRSLRAASAARSSGGGKPRARGWSVFNSRVRRRLRVP